MRVYASTSTKSLRCAGTDGRISASNVALFWRSSVLGPRPIWDTSPQAIVESQPGPGRTRMRKVKETAAEPAPPDESKFPRQDGISSSKTSQRLCRNFVHKQPAANRGLFSYRPFSAVRIVCSDSNQFRLNLLRHPAIAGGRKMLIIRRIRRKVRALSAR